MTGIERLRKLAQNCRTASVNGYTTVIANVHAAAVEAIADQIEREGEEYDRRQSKRWTIVWWMVREMEQHVSGVEGMEDSPVAHWARELRYALKSDTSYALDAQNPSCADPDETANVSSEAPKVTREDAEAIAWVREHGGLELVSNRDYALTHVLDWLREQVGAGNDETRDLDEMMLDVEARLMPEGMEWLLEVWPKWSNGEYCKFGDWWKSDKYGEHEPNQFRKLSIYTPEKLREWGQDDGDHFGYEWDFVRPSDPKYRPEKVDPPAPKVLDADGAECHVGDHGYWLDQPGIEIIIKHIDPHEMSQLTVYDVHGRGNTISAEEFTHRAPVLAADGKPLREGESGREIRVDKIEHRPDGFYALELFADGSKRHSAPVSILAHERPDSWERLEEDVANASCPDVYCANHHIDASDASYEWAMARDIVRRAKALAERDL